MTPAPLRVSPNGRFLVRGDEPFFWLGDTAWHLFQRLTLSEARHYFGNRAEKAFTVIQAVGLAELDGLDSPNTNGDFPLFDRDPTRPNPAYWAHVDAVVDAAQASGLVIGFLPTWGNHWHHPTEGIFTEDNAFIYGAWLGRRYRDADVVWILGGDRAPEEDLHRKIIESMAAGLREGDEGRHLQTYHTNGRNGSARFFHAADWLDFNMRQNGHGVEYLPGCGQTAADYARRPAKPVLDGEPIYEDIPIEFESQNGFATAGDVRRALYWDLFSGACGHTYGHNSVWQMWTSRRNPVLHPLMPWNEALDRPAAGQMQHARWLLESRPFLRRIPDQTFLLENCGDQVATRDAKGSYAMIYSPRAESMAVDLRELNAPLINAWHFDPCTGNAFLLEAFPKTTRKIFPPPPGATDWILVLDDAAQDFRAPGMRMSEKS